MKKHISGICAITMICGMVAYGEEVELERVKDMSIRISLGSAPGIDEVEDSTGSGSVDDDGGARVEVLFVKRWLGDNPVGGFLGGGLFIGSHALSDSGVEVDLTTFGGMIAGGFVGKIGNAFTYEVGPYLGLGIAENETTGYESGSGSYAFFGVKGGAFVSLGDSIELGLELGYEGFSHEQEYEGGWLGNETVTFSGSGAHVAAVLAVKF